MYHTLHFYLAVVEKASAALAAQGRQVLYRQRGIGGGGAA